MGWSVRAYRVAAGSFAIVSGVVSGCGTAADRTGPEPAPVAAQQPAPLVVSPSEGPPFTVVTVSGGGCSGASPSVTGELETPTGDGQPGGTGAIPGASGVFFVTSPDESGGWTRSFIVPPVVPPGPYRVVAQCTTGPDAAPVVYPPEPFEVLAGESASMSVTPTRAPSGVDVVLDVAGSVCRGSSPQVDVQVHPAGSEEGGEFVAAAVFTPDADGNWSGQVVIPAGPPATYVVGAVCNLESQPFFIYLPASASGEVPTARLVEIGGRLPPSR